MQKIEDGIAIPPVKRGVLDPALREMKPGQSVVLYPRELKAFLSMARYRGWKTARRIAFKHNPTSSEPNNYRENWGTRVWRLE